MAGTGPAMTPSNLAYHDAFFIDAVSMCTTS